MKKVISSVVIFLVCFVNFAFADDDWTLKGPYGSQPDARYAHATAYIGDYKMLLFGGYAGGHLDDTWVYDLSSNSWSNKNPSIKPNSRHSHAMAYIGDDKVLLFGGYHDIDGYNNETWIYNLSDNAWTQMGPIPSPSARRKHKMAYIEEDQVLLFGGYTGPGNFNNETWLYDLSDNTWTQLNPVTKPSARFDHELAYIGDDHFVLFGGDGGVSYLREDTWIYDVSDNNWTQKFVTDPNPQGRIAHAMAYIGGDQVVMFGGYSDYPVDVVFGDTWIYDLSDNTWTEDTNLIEPSNRLFHTLCETSLDGSSYLVLFGGTPNWPISNLSDETWTFGGGDYSLPVELSTFSAIAANEQVTLKWTTESEVENAGFNVYRSYVEEGSYLQINGALISGAGSTTERQQYQFTDFNVTNGITYYYKLEDVDIKGIKTFHGPISATPMAAGVKTIPKEFCLHANYPNPFNPTTTIDFDLPEEDFVQLTVYDLLGNRVITLVEEQKKAGAYQSTWDGKNHHGQKLSSGVYFYRLVSGRHIEVKKMTLMQ